MIWEELDEEITRQYKMAGFEIQTNTKATTEEDVNRLMQFFGH